MEENDAEAFRLWKIAAEAGSIKAQENLAFCYEDGVGTEKNLAEAEKWYAIAAEGRRKRAKMDPTRTKEQKEMEEAAADIAAAFIAKGWKLD